MKLLSPSDARRYATIDSARATSAASAVSPLALPFVWPPGLQEARGETGYDCAGVRRLLSVRRRPGDAVVNADHSQTGSARARPGHRQDQEVPPWL